MDIYSYRNELVKKLGAVDEVIAGMGLNAPKRLGRPKKSGGDIVGNGRGGSDHVGNGATKKRRKMSKSAKLKIAAAQKARWAKFHADKKK
jgi:hypothetical protein